MAKIYQRNSITLVGKNGCGLGIVGDNCEVTGFRIAQLEGYKGWILRRLIKFFYKISLEGKDEPN